MASPQLTANPPRRLRANRAVVDKTCTSCGAAFGLAEEVYKCAACGEYHHTTCWDAAGRCACQRDKIPAPSPGPEGGPNPPATSGEPSAVAGQPLPTGAEATRKCPSCARVIKQAAMKCRFCGTLLDQRLISRMEEETIPPQVLEEVRNNANKAIWYSILGVVLCATPIFAPIAIIAGHDALRTLRKHPAYPTSLRSRARLGIVMGWIAIVIFAIGMISKLGS